MIKLIFHCSDSYYGNSRIIRNWHRRKGYRNIAYHYVIKNGVDRLVYNAKNDGIVEVGRKLNSDHIVDCHERGAHTKYHNKNSIGICLIGKSGRFTRKQAMSAFKLVYKLEKQYKWIKIHQHSEFTRGKRHCAGLNLIDFKFQYWMYKNGRLYT
jgi:N-acetyl-anhydromuramyl-L-alanine amidase AmpD